MRPDTLVHGPEFDSLEQARRRLREKSLRALEYQVEVLDWMRTTTSQEFYENFAGGFAGVDITPEQAKAQGAVFHRTAKEWFSSASTFYVSADMTELIDHSQRTLIPATLEPEMLYSQRGFLVFARPILITGTYRDRAGGLIQETGRIKAVLWGRNLVGSAGRGAVRQPNEVHDGVTCMLFTTATEYAAETSIPQDEVRQRCGPLPLWDMTGWTFHMPWQEDDSGDLGFGWEENGVAHVGSLVGQIRRLMLTTWSMLEQKIMTVDHARPPRGLARRAAKYIPNTGDVLIIRLRKEQREQGETGEPTEVFWSHRWIVTGYWKKQRYGPKRALTKLIYVAEYVKGPEHLPLVVKDKIWSLER